MKPFHSLDYRVRKAVMPLAIRVVRAAAGSEEANLK
jgi:hypothetical protein